MPQNTRKRKAYQEFKNLKKKLAKLEEVLYSNSSSETSDSQSESSQSSHSSSADEHEEEDVVPTPVVATQDGMVTKKVPSFLGENPDLSTQLGTELHEELVVRWSNYLREGVSSEIRKDLVKKFLIPSNCLALQPPKMNEEIRSVLLHQIQKNDKFLSSLQEQMGAGLTAIGQILNSKII
ncbi:unnamed protein product [Phaedon cochleariae]|uniref:Uncharacterized protein n=1 Tax=Phaedon cochleariae TaxID=80249 RepID=A0A9N9SAZ5_PHACE|nr:unnamed protein product [Phaedon cochleariae]